MAFVAGLHKILLKDGCELVPDRRIEPGPIAYEVIALPTGLIRRYFVDASVPSCRMGKVRPLWIA